MPADTPVQERQQNQPVARRIRHRKSGGNLGFRTSTVDSALNATVFSVEQPSAPVRALDMIELAKEPTYMNKLDEAIRTNESLPAEDEAQQKSFDIMVARLRKWRHYLMELAKQP